MEKYQSLYSTIICSFSAGSNVTGIITNVSEVVAIVKKFDAIMIFDYAGVGPYIKIDMSQGIDAICLSPHKFLGGPGSSGILIFNNWIYPKNLDPTHGGGGTVDFVNEDDIIYSDSIQSRE